MALPVDDLSVSQALVVDSNPTSRSILVSQLRDFGMGSVVQCARLADARRQLEHRSFDVVLCEHHFANEASSGQAFSMTCGATRRPRPSAACKIWA